MGWSILGRPMAADQSPNRTWIARCRPEQQGSAFACIDPTAAGPRLFFQRVPEGKVVKNRVHLDARVGTGLVGDERLAALDSESARLVALGAARVRLLPADDENESCLVMQAASEQVGEGRHARRSSPSCRGCCDRR